MFVSHKIQWPKRHLHFLYSSFFKKIYFQLSEIGCSSFYGKKEKTKIITVFPPENVYISDVESSSSDEELDYSADRNIESSVSLPQISAKTNNFDDDWSTDDELSLAALAEVERKNKKRKKENTRVENRATNYKWSKEEFQFVQIPTEKQYDTPVRTLTCLQYFQQFFDNSIFQYISDQTNSYSTLVTGSSINTSPSEIKTFIGIQLLMGVIKMPSYEGQFSLGTV